jgi:hypothetical protein
MLFDNEATIWPRRVVMAISIPSLDTVSGVPYFTRAVDPPAVPEIQKKRTCFRPPTLLAHSVIKLGSR